MMQLIDGTFFTPYFIFIKDYSKLTDIELLDRLGLNNYGLITSRKEKFKGYGSSRKRYLYVSDKGEWKHLMDDSCYTLWHNQELKRGLQELSKDFDIFCCSIGDIDDSFDFIYYQNGTVRREYVVRESRQRKEEIIEDIGLPFEIEELALLEESERTKVLEIAIYLGIDIEHDLEEIRCYGYLKNEHEF